MSKAAIGLGILGIGATTAVAAPLAMTLNSGSNGEMTDGDITSSLPSATGVGTLKEVKINTLNIPTLSKASDIKSQYENTECLKEFKEGDGNSWPENNEQAESTTPTLTSISQSSTDLKGCLSIEHNKQTQNDKWKGKFKLVWSLSNESERFVTILVVDANNASLMLSTSVYIMKKDGSSWAMSYQKEDVIQMITSDGDLNEKFPKSSSSTKNGDSDEYWGFDPKMNKICNGECAKMTEVETTISKKWTWSGGGSEGAPITNFSSNFDSWFKKPFGSQEITIVDSLKNIKGTWSLQSQ